MSTAREREALEQAIVRGSELLKQGKLDQALRAFHHALELDPESTKALALLGLAHFRGGQFAEARPIYEELVERTPTDASHRLNLGLVCLKLGDGDRAIEALEASRALDPSQGRAVSYLGLAYARAGRYADAYRSFLLAGQVELATEIEVNLTAAERDGINSQLGRTPGMPFAPPTPAAAPPVAAAPPPHPAPAAPRLPLGAMPSERHNSPTAPIAPVIVAQQAAAMGRTPPHPTPTNLRVHPRAITQNIVPRAVLEDAQGTRKRPPSAPPADVHTRPTPTPVAEPAAPEITILHQDTVRGRSADDIVAIGPPPRMTESQQFVLPTRVTPTAAAAPAAGHSMVSMAVAAAAPLTPGAARTAAAGGRAPRPLSELATDELIRPDEGDERLEIGPNGNLVIRIVDRMLVRLEGVHVTGGDLVYEQATRRTRGAQTDERFDHGGASLHVVSGRGYLIAMPGKHTFEAVVLDDDILYLREDLVFAFEASLRWENGNVPGLRGRLPVVQFRGDGVLALRTARPLTRVKLPAQGMVFVDAERLAGWIGRVIPRAVVPPTGGPLGAMCVECTGEGVVLVEPAPEPRPSPNTAITQPMPVAPHAHEPRRSGTHAVPPPPPPAAQELEPEDVLSVQDARPAMPPELVELGAALADDGDDGDRI